MIEDSDSPEVLQGHTRRIVLAVMIMTVPAVLAYILYRLLDTVITNIVAVLI
jgi:hypothetical protein